MNADRRKTEEMMGVLGNALKSAMEARAQIEKCIELSEEYELWRSIGLLYVSEDCKRLEQHLNSVITCMDKETR